MRNGKKKNNQDKVSDNMELSINNKSDNNSLNRQEIDCTVSFDKQMPSRKKLRQEIASAAGVDEKLLIIVSAQGAYGTNTAKVIAHIYKDKESMLATEKEHLLMRDGLIEKQEPKKTPKPQTKEKPTAKPEKKGPPKPEAKKEAPKKEEKPVAKPEEKQAPAKKPEQKEGAPKHEKKKPEPKKQEKKPEEKKAEKTASPKGKEAKK